MNTNWCPYKLPCGYCEKLGRDCPKSEFGPATTNSYGSTGYTAVDWAKTDTITSPYRTDTKLTAQPTTLTTQYTT